LLFVILAPAVAVALAAALSCRGGCARARPPTVLVEGPLALFPLETRMVVAFDFARLRASPAALKLAALAQQSPADAHTLEELTSRTGLDPIHGIDSVVLAFPEEARRTNQFGMIVRAPRFDQTRLVAYVRDELQKKGDDLVATTRGPRTLWSARHDPSVAGFFADDRTFVLGAGGWAARMADLADRSRPSDSAATNLELVGLAERAAGNHAIWAAAQVPSETRRKLAEEPRFKNAAAVMTLALGIDLKDGLQAVLESGVATAADAEALAARTRESLLDAKRNAQVLMLGLGPYLDGVTARAVDKTFELRATLTEAQLDDLIGRLGALLTLTRQGRAPGFGQ
jgi:hypothetical protein